MVLRKHLRDFSRVLAAFNFAAVSLRILTSFAEMPCRVLFRLWRFSAFAGCADGTACANCED